jgi:hypothetical protein
MADPVYPEIIPPGSQPSRRRPTGSQGGMTDENLDRLAQVLDDVFQVPGTRIRFGLDALLGLLPGLGDAASGLASCVIIVAAWKRGLPRVTIARMLANVALDSMLGAIPIIGDLFDVAWKSNRMNVNLLQRSQGYPTVKQTAADWLFLLLVLAATIGIAALPFVLLALLVRSIGR